MKKLATLCFLALFMTLSSSAQYLIFDDPLTNGTTVGTLQERLGPSTSTYTSEGWQPGAAIGNMNHIAYDAPYFFKEGYLEFEMKGMEIPTNPDNDPAFVGLFDGRNIPDGIVTYNDHFKQNYYRWNVHYRGDNHAFKCKIQMAANTEEKDTRELPVLMGATYSTDAECLTEPNGSGYSFNKTTWYTVRVEWKNKTYSVKVNGTQVWSVTQACDYTPRNLRIWLGCAPANDGKYSATVPGLTFRNFKLYSWDKPALNYGHTDIVNLPATSYVSFGKNLPNEVTTKEMYFKNLSASSMPVIITSNNGDFSAAQTSFTLAPNEKKFVTFTMNGNATVNKRTTFSITAPGIAYSMTCIASVIDQSVVTVTEYEDLFDDGVANPFFKIENSLYYSVTESAGAMNINVAKSPLKVWSAMYFEPKNGVDSFFINMTTAPYMAVRIKSTKNFLFQLGPNNFGATGNPNTLPAGDVSEYTIPPTPANVVGDGQWQWLVFDFTQRFIANGFTPSSIRKIFMNFDPGAALTATVNLDHFIVGQKALLYTDVKDGRILSDEGLGFYPNPSKSMIYLKNVEQVQSVSISDITGRQLLNVNPTNAGISVENLKVGVYFVSIINKNQTTQTTKLIKN